MQVITGILLLFVYSSTISKAYDSVLILQNDVLFGKLIRNMQHWGANFLIIVLFLHELRYQPRNFLMRCTLPGIKADLPIDVNVIAALIVETQKESGEIPWCEGAKTDPWDHVEAAMGLSVGGYLKEAKQAFKWMARTQLADGSWHASYKEGVPQDRIRDSNMSSYIAVGVFHYYLITGDMAFLKNMWPNIEAAINFALSLQAPGGEIYWAVSPEGNIDTMALLTGSSSVYMSIKCALAIAEKIGCRRPAWQEGLRKLRHAIQHKPHLFNMTKSRYSMDWFYPILSGALTGESAQKRIDRFWNKFVIKDQGVRCVSDRPWVTVAETCEFIVTLAAIGNLRLANILFNWIQNKTNQDGSYWCGFTCPDMTIWPEDKSTWTNAAVLLAADAVFNLTPAGQLFSHRFWEAQKCLTRIFHKAV